MTISAPRVFVIVATAVGGCLFALAACSDSEEMVTPAPSAEAGDSGLPDARLAGDVVQLVDAECAEGKLGAPTGESCVGFGTGTPCDRACGIPAYGYVCFNGGPPNQPACLQMTKSSLGETYCCPELGCVPQPDQDTKCTSAATPHRYQCPPGEEGGITAPPPGCADGGSGPTAVERFFCCP